MYVHIYIYIHTMYVCGFRVGFAIERKRSCKSSTSGPDSGPASISGLDKGVCKRFFNQGLHPSPSHLSPPSLALPHVTAVKYNGSTG